MMFFPLETLLYFIAILLVLWAQFSIKGAYEKYSRVAANTRFTGLDVANMILRRQGIFDVDVEQAQGLLSDHYDPRSKKVRLSPAVYNTNSIAAVSIAAHEVGHAIQDSEGYKVLALRNTLLPLAIVSGNFGWTILIIGLIFNNPTLLWAGIAMLGVIAVFQLVTLPIEFDASSRALRLLVDEGILGTDEQYHARKMLSAAALTYVAALLASLLQILRFVLIANRRR